MYYDPVFYITGAVGFVWIAWFLLSYRGVARSASPVKSTIRWATLLRYRTTWGACWGRLAICTPTTCSRVTYLTLAIASFSLATGSINSMMVDIAPPHIVSSLVSLQNFGGNVGGSLAPVVTGVLLATTKSFTVPLLLTSLVALIGCAPLA